MTNPGYNDPFGRRTRNDLWTTSDNSIVAFLQGCIRGGGGLGHASPPRNGK